MSYVFFNPLSKHLPHFTSLFEIDRGNDVLGVLEAKEHDEPLEVVVATVRETHELDHVDISSSLCHT